MCSSQIGSLIPHSGPGRQLRFSADVHPRLSLTRDRPELAILAKVESGPMDHHLKSLISNERKIGPVSREFSSRRQALFVWSVESGERTVELLHSARPIITIIINLESRRGFQEFH